MCTITAECYLFLPDLSWASSGRLEPSAGERPRPSCCRLQTSLLRMYENSFFIIILGKGKKTKKNKTFLTKYSLFVLLFNISGCVKNIWGFYLSILYLIPKLKASGHFIKQTTVILVCPHDFEPIKMQTSMAGNRKSQNLMIFLMNDGEM